MSVTESPLQELRHVAFAGNRAAVAYLGVVSPGMRRYMADLLVDGSQSQLDALLKRMNPDIAGIFVQNYLIISGRSPIDAVTYFAAQTGKDPSDVVAGASWGDFCSWLESIGISLSRREKARLLHLIKAEKSVTEERAEGLRATFSVPAFREFLAEIGLPRLEAYQSRNRQLLFTEQLPHPKK